MGLIFSRTYDRDKLGNSQWKSNIILVIKKILKLVRQEESSSLVVDYYCFEACVLSSNDRLHVCKRNLVKATTLFQSEQ